MKNALWLIVGIGLGFAAAHQVAKSPKGRQFFDEVDTRAHEFASALVDGYKEREAELRSAMAETEDVISDLGKRVK